MLKARPRVVGMQGFGGRPASLLAVLALALLLPAPLCHGADQLHLVLSGSARHYQQVADNIATHLERHHPGVTLSRHYSNDLAELAPSPHSLLVCIGTVACREATVRFPSHPQLSLFITAESWRHLSSAAETRHKAGLLLDQPPERLVALGRVLAPGASRYVAALGPISGNREEVFAAAARNQGVTLVAVTIAPDSNPLTTLTPLMEGAELFLAVPDTAAFNRNIAKWALYLAFRHKIPVIGFSQAYTGAGAAASLYTAPEDIGRQANGWLDTYLAADQFNDWRALPPAFFTISVNRSVLHSLGLGRQDAAQLTTAVQRHLRELPQ